MTYDLRRLRLNGLIHRLPRSNRYMLTDDGIRIAIFYTKIYNRLLVPLTAADQPQAPPDLRRAGLHHTPRRRLRNPRPPTTRRVKLDRSVKTLATKDR
jgi:hypothetical protein